MRDAVRAVPRRELALLVGAVALGLVIRVAFLVSFRHHPLAGDEVSYDVDAKLWAGGHPFWSASPFGIPHVSMWKAPGYTAWAGVLYDVLGSGKYHRIEALQVILAGPLTITLVWALARRLFDARVGTIAAFAAAIYPFIWQFEPLLYSEAIAVPLAAGLMLIVLDRTPTTRRAAAAGLVLGLSMLIRPTSVMFGAMIAVTWWSAAGLRAGTKMTVISALCALLVIVPWTIRNHSVSGGFVPISVQDAAAYGTFNDEAAHDSEYPWAWRPIPADYRALFAKRPPPSDLELRRTLQKRARRYVSKHPSSLVKAWWYNGISRTFDIRWPSHVQNDVTFEGRSRSLTWVGLIMYWILAPLGLLSLWLLRRRRALVLPVIALVAVATLVFTSAGGTRYRATIEPLILVLGCAAPGLVLGRRAGEPTPAPDPS